MADTRNKEQAQRIMAQAKASGDSPLVYCWWLLQTLSPEHHADLCEASVEYAAWMESAVALRPTKLGQHWARVQSARAFGRIEHMGQPKI